MNTGAFQWLQGHTQGGIKGFLPPKLNLTADAEYVADLVNVSNVVVNMQQCSLLNVYAIPA